MENCAKRPETVGSEYSNGWRACSACAGDYEDPDRTAPPEDEPDEDAEWDAAEDFLLGGKAGQA